MTGTVRPARAIDAEPCIVADDPIRGDAEAMGLAKRAAVFVGDAG